jgi:excisionase family DNA binding protein
VEDRLSVHEVADACGVAYRTLPGMVRRGELSAEKPDGKPYRILRADLDAFIRRARVGPGELASAAAHIPPQDQQDRIQSKDSHGRDPGRSQG